MADPALSPTELAGIAAAQPGLWTEIAWHPLAWPDLLGWMAHYGDDNVRWAVQQRWAADVARYGAPATPPVPPLRKDIVKTLWVYIAVIATIQLVGSVFLIAMIFANVTTLSTISTDVSNLTEQITEALGPWLGWMQVFAVLAGASWYLLLRQSRLVTTDITTTNPVAGRWGLLAKLGLVMLAIQGVLFIVTSLLSLVGIDLSSSQDAGVNPLLSSFIGVAYITVIGPILEEIMFRGAILRHLAPYGTNFAIVTQAVLFGIYHLNLYQGPFAFVIGLVLGYVALRFSIKWAMLLHIANNTLAVLVSLWPLAGMVFTVVILLALAAVILLAVLGRDQYRALIAEGRPAIPHPFRTAWSNPLFIVVLVVGVLACTGFTLMVLLA